MRSLIYSFILLMPVLAWSQRYSASALRPSEVSKEIMSSLVEMKMAFEDGNTTEGCYFAGESGMMKMMMDSALDNRSTKIKKTSHVSSDALIRIKRICAEVPLNQAAALRESKTALESFGDYHRLIERKSYYQETPVVTIYYGLLIDVLPLSYEPNLLCASMGSLAAASRLQKAMIKDQGHGDALAFLESSVKDLTATHCFKQHPSRMAIRNYLEVYRPDLLRAYEYFGRLN
jgi:hypothetical protein